MELRRALRLGETPKLAVVGAGGKTSALFQIAGSYSGKVILTTSTHLSREQASWGDAHIILRKASELPAALKGISQGIIVITGPLQANRATGLSGEMLSRLNHYCTINAIPLLIEADGARRLPLKAPAAHEPAIPGFVKTVVVMAGLSALGKRLNSRWVHRPERFAQLSGIRSGDRITRESIVQVLTHPEGGLKHIPGDSRRIVLLNQVDTAELQDKASDMAKSLLGHYEAVVSASLRTRDAVMMRRDSRSEGNAVEANAMIHSVHESIAGIILAAGEARRYGKPKQLLNWRGKPLVWQVAKCACDSGLRPVIVVTGAYVNEIETAVGDLPVETLHNQDWQSGQGTSVSTGIEALPTGIGGAVFLLADQPQIPSELIHLLVQEHTRTLAPIVAPWVAGHRENPVLFDRDLFKDLRGLSGDTGGRQLFSKYDMHRVSWDDPNVFLDVDTPDDYRRLMGAER